MDKRKYPENGAIKTLERFPSDYDARRPSLRTFSVVDDFNGEALLIEIDFNLLAPRVMGELERIAAVRGTPVKLRLDNGPDRKVARILSDERALAHLKLIYWDGRNVRV